MVGRLGTQQLGAVSVASLVVSFATFLFSFLMFLTTPEIAAAVSKGDKAEDTRTPLYVAMGSAALSLLLNYTFICVFQWGVAGAALAVTLAQASSATALCGLLVAKGMLQLKDLLAPPAWSSVSPLLRRGSVLALRNIISMVFQWGVAGAALAVTLAQASSATALCGLLVAKGMLQLKDLLAPPAWSSVSPLLRRGSVLALRNIISM
ncbi:multidrug and toxic compound extrusion protein, partial [Haematococcus lacustris]